MFKQSRFADLAQDKSFMITGGTGSFGNKVAKRLLEFDVKRLIILSRDEKKQDDMRKAFSDPRIRFVVGDVRNQESVLHAMQGADYVFHAAALKQVPTCEFYPLEAALTNIQGAANVIRSAVTAGVSNVVVLSTDKAVYPINAMGISKAMMEKVMVGESRRVADLGLGTICSGTRYGNVLASRGSVVPLFIDQIKSGGPITITDPTMTRFLMSLGQAVDLVLKSFLDAENGDIHVQKSSAATVDTIAKALIKMTGSDVSIRYIGARHGEKFHETLVSREEMAVAESIEGFYRIPCDRRSQNYNLGNTEGCVGTKDIESYTSANTYRLSVDEVCDLFENTKEVRDLL